MQDEFAEHRWRQRLMSLDMALHLAVNVALVVAASVAVYILIRRELGKG